MSTHPKVVVAIPARDEADRIRDCLEALDGQRDARIDTILLVVNNSSDTTAAIARRMTSVPDLRVIETTLPPARANAGHARRLAMRLAARVAGPDGILLTTDADSRADPDWVAANLAALRRGAEAVAGWVELDAVEWGRIPPALHEADALECAYDTLCDEIHARLDPDPADPWPRHTQEPGASLAMTVAAYRRAGGVPAVASGEDRALVAALRRVDAPVRHAPEVHVTVSGRLDGRAPGGMADTIRRRMTMPDAFIDSRLEPAADCARRATLRHAVMSGSCDSRSLAKSLELPPDMVARAMRGGRGMAWDAIERASPLLRRRLVPVRDLARETAAARAILARLSQAGPADLSDSLAAGN